MSSKPHRIYARPIIRDGRHFHGAERAMYSAHHNGAEIVAMTRKPLLDGARALQAMGLDKPSWILWNVSCPAVKRSAGSIASHVAVIKPPR